jgi:hypothetical protein
MLQVYLVFQIIQYLIFIKYYYDDQIKEYEMGRLTNL